MRLCVCVFCVCVRACVCVCVRERVCVCVCVRFVSKSDSKNFVRNLIKTKLFEGQLRTQNKHQQQLLKGLPSRNSKVQNVYVVFHF